MTRDCSVASVDNVYVQTVPVIGREEDLADLEQAIYYSGTNTQVSILISCHI